MGRGSEGGEYQDRVKAHGARERYPRATVHAADSGGSGEPFFVSGKQRLMQKAALQISEKSFASTSER